jgi:hypothetical protein
MKDSFDVASFISLNQASHRMLSECLAKCLRRFDSADTREKPETGAHPGLTVDPSGDQATMMTMMLICVPFGFAGSASY